MTDKYEQLIVMSKTPLLGQYRYRDKFQLLPHKIEVPQLMCHYPLVLELRYNDEVYPIRSDDFWHRDVWERKRFETLKNKLQNRKMDEDDPWVKSYQQLTRQIRKPAIIQEILNALTVFTNHSFFQYGSEQSWFWAFDEENDDPFKNKWGQIGFAGQTQTNLNDFTKIECGEIGRVEASKYGQIRDPIYADTSKKHEIAFPSYIDVLFEKYFLLPPNEKLAYAVACQLYNQSISFSSKLPSLSFVALAMAIEKMMNINIKNDTPCKKCGAPDSVEKCKCCGAPIYKLRSRFKEFLEIYASPDDTKLYGEIYDMRSTLAHGGLFRTELFDTGFYSGEKEDESGLIRETKKVVHIALLNWLLQFQEPV